MTNSPGNDKPIGPKGPKAVEAPEKGDLGSFFQDDFDFSPTSMALPEDSRVESALVAFNQRNTASKTSQQSSGWIWAVAATAVVALGGFWLTGWQTSEIQQNPVTSTANTSEIAPQDQNSPHLPAVLAENSGEITPSLTKVEGGVELKWSGKGAFKVSKCVDPAFKSCSLVKKVNGNRFLDLDDQEAPLIFYKIEADGQGGSA